MNINEILIDFINQIKIEIDFNFHPSKLNDKCEIEAF